MEPRIQYAKTSDGLSIAFWTMGDGDPPLVMSPPMGWSHISYELRFSEVARWYEDLASARMLVRYDPRNQGHSDRNTEAITEEQLAADVKAVVTRLGRPQVDLMGGAPGFGPPMVRVAAEHPELVRKLVLRQPAIVGARTYATDRMLVVRELIQKDWELFARTFAAQNIGWTDKQADLWSGFMRRAMVPRDATLILDALASIDWSRWLAKVRAPTLVLYGRPRGPTVASNQDVRWGDVEDVRLVELQDVSPWAREAAETLEDFLSDGEVVRGEPKSRVPSGTAIILITDIADSTSLTERLGDAVFHDRAVSLDAALRAAVRDNDGTVIEGKLLGDGILATFAGASQAIAAAVTCSASGASHELPLHVGLHAGDVIREETNVFGGAVNIASRVCGLSAPGEILVTDIVRGLARTSTRVTFEDRGEQMLKGVADLHRVFAVHARDE